jgi:GNAT superfamily N-acetyltransferase
VLLERGQHFALAFGHGFAGHVTIIAAPGHPALDERPPGRRPGRAAGGSGVLTSRGVSVEISFLAPADADDTALVTAVAGLINDIYAEAESGMWIDGAARTSVDEVRQLTRAGEIVVARSDGELIGCVRAQRLGDGLSEFGMLAAAHSVRGTGVGRGLIEFVEHWSRGEGRPTMQLEVLKPREWSHPSKEFLTAWYPRLGYRVVRTGSIDEAYRELAPLLATPCDFVIYHKDLGSS